jgi:hypothetical protein
MFAMYMNTPVTTHYLLPTHSYFNDEFCLVLQNTMMMCELIYEIHMYIYV